MNTLVMLDGGHRITLKGFSPGDVQHFLSERLDEQDNQFCYFQPTDRDQNSIVVDPKKVVALVRLPERSVRDQREPV